MAQSKWSDFGDFRRLSESWAAISSNYLTGNLLCKFSLVESLCSVITLPKVGFPFQFLSQIFLDWVLFYKKVFRDQVEMPFFSNFGNRGGLFTSAHRVKRVPTAYDNRCVFEKYFVLYGKPKRGFYQFRSKLIIISRYTHFTGFVVIMGLISKIIQVSPSPRNFNISTF